MYEISPTSTATCGNCGQLGERLDNGLAMESPTECPDCEGNGEVTFECTECKGTGDVIGSCPTCHGIGKLDYQAENEDVDPFPELRVIEGEKD